MTKYSLRQKLGAVIYDLPRFLWAMRPSKPKVSGVAPWVYFCNRNERLISSASKSGVECDWKWTSDLHIARVFPWLGLSFMKRSLRDCPIGLQSEPIHKSENIEVSFVIGHRGIDRLPHLLFTLQSIAAQRNTSVECIVVEQSKTREIKSKLPEWVRYIHTPPPHQDMPFCRSWAFNVGARVANGELLVLHDNDLLVASDYASELMKLYRKGFEVVNLKRFIFYLNEAHTARQLSAGSLIFDHSPEAITQNAQGGGSIAIARNIYFAIGGFDEAFVGWGGEDNEFWERAQTRSVWPYGYLPFVHLWHAPQSEKDVRERFTARLFEERSAVPVGQRISELAARNSGNQKQLAPSYLLAEPAEAR